MTTMHYRLSRIDHEWVLWSEGVPVQSFESRAEGLKAANALLAAAKQRNDIATLTLDRERQRNRAAA